MFSVLSLIMYAGFEMIEVLTVTFNKYSTNLALHSSNNP